MAFASVTIASSPIETGTGFRLNDIEDVEIHGFTKLTGDTTGTVTPTVLKRIDNVYVYFINGTASATMVAAITNTLGSVAAALTVLETGSNTISGVVIITGSKR